MRPLLLHIGMHKTGTTSIQSSLFRRLGDPRYRLVSLDTGFGNQMVGALFQRRFEEFFIGAMLSERNRSRFRGLAGRYLDRSLAAAREENVVPIISAESIWRFDRDDLHRLKDFVAERGFEARVVGYLRAPLDFVESMFQQRVKVGRSPSFDFQSLSRDWREVLADVLDVFGEGNASFHLFQAAAFPGGCVVRHFCQSTGIEFRPGDVRLENESVNLNAVRFLHALNRAGGFDPKSTRARVQRQVLIELLRRLPGPPLRFHPEATAGFARSMRPQLAWLEDRLGLRVPLTLLRRESDEGVRSEADLGDFSPEALEWLAWTSGNRVVRRGGREEMASEVVQQLRCMTPARFPRAAALVLGRSLQERWRRNRAISRAMRRR